MDQRARTLEVREELVPEPDSLARALDQTGHVGDDELAAVGRLEGAEYRLQRRERIVGDLRLRVRDAGEERRLAGVRQADERRVGEQLQLQLDVVLLTRRTDLCEPRHLPGRRDEASVAAPALAALGEHHARTGVREVGEEVAVLGEDLRPDRHAQLGVVAVRAVLSRPASVLAARRLDERCAAATPRGRGATESATRTTSPPSPPSPPSGPPFGTNFSRRKLSPPSPPLPA